LGDPLLILLDEPSTGVDPDTRRQIWDIIAKQNKVEGKTIILTTHSMLEADTLCTRIGIMSQICLLVSGSTPVDGSSNNINNGSPNKAIPIFFVL
jgi:ABC-type multidrug transport system ATPase subunit